MIAADQAAGEIALSRNKRSSLDLTRHAGMKAARLISGSATS
jgi:hypothetical protein